MPEETAQYIRIPVSEGHDGHRIRTIDISPEKGIKALYCGECREIVTFLFDKEKWTMETAKEWIEEHKGKSMVPYMLAGESEKRGLSIKSETSDQYTIGGYGAVFGGRDLVGEYFDQDTDFWLGKITDKPMIMYDHGDEEDGPGKEIIGRVTKIVKDKIGLWVEAQIEKASEYAEGIRELIRNGKLGFSTGAVGYLVEIAADGKILSWPIAELSLTPTPSEPRTLGVVELRSLAVLNPAIKSFVDNASITVQLVEEEGKKVIRLQF